MGYVIRDFSLTDLGDVLKLDENAFGPESWGADDFVELYQTLDGTFLVARDDQQLVGYVCGMVYAVGAKDRQGYVASIAVSPESRRAGLGKALMDAIKQRFVERGATSIALHVRTTNVAALSMYRDLGFEVVKVMPNYCEDGGPAYLMRLRVAGVQSA